MPSFPVTTNFPIMTPQSQPTVDGSWVERMGHNHPFVPDPVEAINPAYNNPQWAGPYSPGPNFYHPDYPYVGNANPLPGPSHRGYPVDELPRYQPKNPGWPNTPSPFQFPRIPSPGDRGAPVPRDPDDTPMGEPPLFPPGRGMGGGQAPNNPFAEPPAEDPFGNPIPPLQGALDGRGRPGQGGR